MGDSKDLTKKLLYKWKEKKGWLNEEDNTQGPPEGNLKENSPVRNNRSSNILMEAQEALVKLKKSNQHLTEEIDECYMGISRIIKSLKE